MTINCVVLPLCRASRFGAFWYFKGTGKAGKTYATWKHRSVDETANSTCRRGVIRTAAK